MTFAVLSSVLFSCVAGARLASTTYDDIQSLLKSGQESAAELTSYYYLRNFSSDKRVLDVKFLLADIYERQTRIDEMILWLKSIEKDPHLEIKSQPKLAYMLLTAQQKKGDQDAAQIQKSLLLRKFPESEWAKKVVVK